MTSPSDDAAYYAAAERRIEWLTIAVGAAGAASAAIFWRPLAGTGVAIGTLLSWINFRWMKQGIGGLTHLSAAQQASERPRVPKSTYLKFIGRYALLIVVAYVILRGFGSMAAGLLAGLFSVVAAVLIEAVALLFRRVPTDRVGS
ncbi:MAG TPA: ATP synthase subunit I [Candidatus Cybelea sp.]|nr:ATP synthase subunit I [Candidatus Cybelea sp.]